MSSTAVARVRAAAKRVKQARGAKTVKSKTKIPRMPSGVQDGPPPIPPDAAKTEINKRFEEALLRTELKSDRRLALLRAFDCEVVSTGRQFRVMTRGAQGVPVKRTVCGTARYVHEGFTLKFDVSHMRFRIPKGFAARLGKQMEAAIETVVLAGHKKTSPFVDLRSRDFPQTIKTAAITVVNTLREKFGATIVMSQAGIYGPPTLRCFAPTLGGKHVAERVAGKIIDGDPICATRADLVALSFEDSKRLFIIELKTASCTPSDYEKTSLAYGNIPIAGRDAVRFDYRPTLFTQHQLQAIATGQLYDMLLHDSGLEVVPLLVTVFTGDAGNTQAVLPVNIWDLRKRMREIHPDLITQAKMRKARRVQVV